MSWLRATVETLLPTDCGGCDRALRVEDGRRICARCAALLPRTLLPLASPPAGLATAWSWDSYDGPAARTLRRGKYRPDPGAVADVAERLAEAAGGRLPRVERVVPVPQIWTSSLRRGFSPVDRLAETVAERLGVPCDPLLARVGGQAQASLGPAERAQNVRFAFWARAPVAPQDLLLVDDVVTTGATAAACARELLVGGARRVHLLALASAR